MTVEKLIDLLKGFPPSAKVVYQDTVTGFVSVDGFEYFLQDESQPIVRLK